MDIKNQLREGSMSDHFCTDSIRHCGPEYLMKVRVFLCNTPPISSTVNNFSARDKTNPLKLVIEIIS